MPKVEFYFFSVFGVWILKSIENLLFQIMNDLFSIFDPKALKHFWYK